jgi:ABC-type sugar transport system ATPase subunit
LYVSHRLDEILELCDKVTVFRDGRKVVTSDRENLTKMHLVESIVGSEFVTPDQATVSKPDSERPVVLEVQHLARAPMVRDVSFELHEGEILGLAGLVGAGRTETARLIFGADRAEAGTMRLKGTEVRPRSPADAARLGIGLVPEERRAQGLILDRPVDYNLNLSSFSELRWARAIPLIRFDKAHRRAEELVKKLAIKTPSISTPTRQLSGGNQQKVVIGKWVGRQPSVLILDEPSRGVDVGARAEIHNIIREHARAAAGVIVISSEVEEMIGLCDRVLVMAEGTIVGSLAGEEITKENIVALSYAHASKVGAQ